MSPRKKVHPSQEAPPKKSAARRAPSRRARATREVPAREAPLSILMIASEAQPFAKTGGLADVAQALPLALDRLGHRVTLVLPRYRGISTAGMAPLEGLTLTIGGRSIDARLFEQALGGRSRTTLIDCPELYDRGGLYGAGAADFGDNALRFGFLSRAALELAARGAERPSLVHGHDWQAGLAPVYLKTRYGDHPLLAHVPSVFTIHNVAFQGLFAPEWLPALDLGWQLFNPDSLEFWGRVSFLKAGITFSEKITTVSPRYAHEIVSSELGFGFQGILQRRQQDLVGILNGIDTDRWNPAHDGYLPEPFDADRLEGKVVAKRALLQRFGLPTDADAMARPVVGMVSRLVYQKGFDLVAGIADVLPNLGARFVLLGSGEPWLEQLWIRLSAAFPDRIAAFIGFDEARAHLIEGGADIFLMPSRFEPCGLNQMYSLRYGTVPVVRATGGLDDTVMDYDETTGQGNGFKFADASPGALLAGLRRALAVFERKNEWRKIQIAGMKADHSWDVSAREYVKVYRAAIAAVGEHALA